MKWQSCHRYQSCRRPCRIMARQSVSHMLHSLSVSACHYRAMYNREVLTCSRNERSGLLWRRRAYYFGRSADFIIKMRLRRFILLSRRNNVSAGGIVLIQPRPSSCRADDMSGDKNMPTLLVAKDIYARNDSMRRMQEESAHDMPMNDRYLNDQDDSSRPATGSHGIFDMII